MVTMRYPRVLVAAALAAGWLLGTPLLGAAAKTVRAQWGLGEVTARYIQIKQLRSKTVLSFAGPVRATQTDVELRHADRATAELDPKLKFQTLTATGSVSFWTRKKSKEQVQEITGKCGRATVHDLSGKKPVGEQRILIADLVGNVHLEILTKPVAPKPAPPTPAAGAGAKPAEAAPQPMVFDGDRAQVWLTAEGLWATLGEE